MSDSDAALVARTLGGDLTAYAGLMARYRDRFGRYAFHMLGNREDAQEALQDSFVRAYRSLASCRQPERFSAWLFRIVVNRCRTVRRRLQRDRRFDADLPDDVPKYPVGVPARPPSNTHVRHVFPHAPGLTRWHPST